MLKHWIRYLILLFMVGVLYIFYVGYISWFLFYMTLSLPLISLFFLIIGMRNLHISMQCDEVSYKNQQHYLKLHSRTGTIIPLACVEAVTAFHNHFTNESEELTLSFASEHHPTQVKIALPFQTLGCMDITISQVKCYDLLGLFYIKKRLNEQKTTYCFPSVKEWSEPVEIQASLQEDGDGGRRNGFESGETFDVHEYRPGDSLHRIHWKLSAKMDELMVREFSATTKATSAVYFELYGSQEDCEQILSHVYNFSRYLFRVDGEHDIAQFMNGTKCWEMHVETLHDLDACIKHLLSHPCMSSTTPDFGEEFHQRDVFLIQKDGLRRERGEAHEKS